METIRSLATRLDQLWDETVANAERLAVMLEGERDAVEQVFGQLMDADGIPDEFKSIWQYRVAPGTLFKIQGRNLFPPGSDGFVTVKVGGIQAPPGEVRRLADDSIEAVAPPGMSQQDKTVRVITAAQTETNAYQVSIQEGLSIIGFVGPPAASGKPGRIRVQGLSADSNVEVAFGTVVTTGIASIQERTISMTVPPGLASGAEVPVRIGVEDRWGPTTNLKLG